MLCTARNLAAMSIAEPYGGCPLRVLKRASSCSRMLLVATPAVALFGPGEVTDAIAKGRGYPSPCLDHFIVGIENCAPSLRPEEGQRWVTVLRRV